jgi:protein TonB
MIYLVTSLLIHGLIFIFYGVTFLQQAQYSVQPSVQTLEVTLREVNETSDARIFKTITNSIKIASSEKSVARHNKYAAHSISGVQVKANPAYIQNPAPEYPEFARHMRQEGIVILCVDVDGHGKAEKVEIQKSSGYYLLDQAALKAVQHWNFKPGSIDRVPVESTVSIPIRFRLT